MRWLPVCLAAAASVVVPRAAAASDPSATTEPLPWAHEPAGTLLVSAFFGDGLRFNNPYRLATPLGSTAESVSRTATYVDLGLAAMYGDARGLEHGVALRMSIATEGVPQTVFTPTYLLWRRFRAVAVYGRAGPSIVATPDLSWGFEGSAGAAWFLRGGIGLAAEIVGDVYYGAGTREVAIPAYPVLSGQLGVILSYEVFP